MTTGEPDSVRLSADIPPPGASDAFEVDWTPGWDWLGLVLAIHVLVAVPWVINVGVVLVPVAVAVFGYYVWVFRRAESWRLALVDERLVLFEPQARDGSRQPARLRGPPWMTDGWIVLRTTRRILVIRAGRYEAAVFARLRRALLARKLPQGPR